MPDLDGFINYCRPNPLQGELHLRQLPRHRRRPDEQGAGVEQRLGRSAGEVVVVGMAVEHDVQPRDVGGLQWQLDQQPHAGLARLESSGVKGDDRIDHRQRAAGVDKESGVGQPPECHSS